MGQISAKLRKTTDGYAWWCPACQEMHAVNSGWAFNGDLTRPSFTPSVKVTYRHPKGHTNENPAPVGWNGEYVDDICHFFLTDGQLRFCGDCTHAFAGRTVPLPDLPTDLQD